MRRNLNVAVALAVAVVFLEDVLKEALRLMNFLNLSVLYRKIIYIKNYPV